MNNPKMMNDLLALSHVPRWSIVAHFKPQSVADHSYRATIVFLELSLRLETRVPYEAILYALIHDAAEAWTGDIPGPYKAPEQGFRDLELAPWIRDVKIRVDPVHLLIFKLADTIETGTFIKKYGVGKHAERVGTHIIEKEIFDLVTALAPQIGWGPAKLQEVTATLIHDIISEEGRWSF